MSFTSYYSNQALKALKRVDKVLVGRLLKKIDCLLHDPVPHDAKSIHGQAEVLFRVRVGSYRILYEVDNKAKTIGIVKIDKRSRAY